MIAASPDHVNGWYKVKPSLSSLASGGLPGYMMYNVVTESTTERIIDYLSGRAVERVEDLLGDITHDLDLKHISYMRYHGPSDPGISELISTYPIAWQRRYSAKNYISVDPVVSFGQQAVVPFDWDELRSGDPIVEEFFGDAVGYGVGRNGISLPLRNRAGELSIVSFNSDRGHPHWREYKNANASSLQLAANIIDVVASFTKKREYFPAPLTRNERRCLILFARGMQPNQIGEELRMSFSLVRLYLDTARHKLFCMNLDQAIRIAIATETISADELK